MFSQITKNEEALREEKKVHVEENKDHKEPLAATKIELAEAITKDVKVLYNAFKNVADQVEVMCPSVQIPQGKMNSYKLVMHVAIINDDEV